MSAVLERSAATDSPNFAQYRPSFALAANLHTPTSSRRTSIRDWNPSHSFFNEFEHGWARNHATNARHSTQFMVFIYGQDMNELVLGGDPTKDWLEDFDELKSAMPSAHFISSYSAKALVIHPIKGDGLGDAQWIKDNFSLSMSEIASLFGVTRKAVYDWFDGSKPRQQMSDRIAGVREILEKNVNSDHRKYVRLFWSTRIDGDTSLLDLLKLPDATPEIIAHSAHLMEKINARIGDYVERNDSKRSRNAIGRTNTDDMFRSI